MTLLRHMLLILAIPGFLVPGGMSFPLCLCEDSCPAMLRSPCCQKPLEPRGGPDAREETECSGCFNVDLPPPNALKKLGSKAETPQGLAAATPVLDLPRFVPDSCTRPLLAARARAAPFSDRSPPLLI